MAMTADAETVRAAASRLLAAHTDQRPCAPIRDLIDPSDVDSAYAVQSLLTEARLSSGATVVGHKIGLTSPAVQQQLGVDRPDFGLLFDDMAYDSGAEVPMRRLMQPKVEAELAFVLGSDLSAGPLDLAQVRDSVAYAVAALEIVDSRIAGWDITFADTVADNASSGLYVLGAQHVPLSELEPATVSMSMTVDGEVVSTGTGSACLGDPLLALQWLARTARDVGSPLRAGDVVLSGALGPMVPAVPGAEVSAEITDVGTVSAHFSEEHRS